MNQQYYGGQQADKWVKLAVYTDGMQRIAEFNEFPFEIGRRAAPGGLTLDDKSVSGRHAIMDLQDGILTITDANSRNGVEVDGAWATPEVPKALKVGSCVVVGRTQILISDMTTGMPAPMYDDGYGQGDYSNQTMLLDENDEYVYEDANQQWAEPQPPQQPAYQPGNYEQSPPPPPPAAMPVSSACGRCGAICENSKFCLYCGAQMEAAPPPPQAAAPGVTPKKFCVSCGAKNVYMEMFCGVCGAKMT